MGKGSGGGGGSGVGGRGSRSRGTVAASVAAVNGKGLLSGAGFLRGEGMRPTTQLDRGYEGVSAKAAEAIATGRRSSKTGQKIPPLSITVEWEHNKARPNIVLTDGRHRASVAKRAGAKHHRARIRTFSEDGNGGWREGPTATRKVRL